MPTRVILLLLLVLLACLPGIAVAQTSPVCDVNQDGSLDVLDVQALVNGVLGTQPNPCTPTTCTFGTTLLHETFDTCTGGLPAGWVSQGQGLAVCSTVADEIYLEGSCGTGNYFWAYPDDAQAMTTWCDYEVRAKLRVIEREGGVVFRQDFTSYHFVLLNEANDRLVVGTHDWLSPGVSNVESAEYTLTNVQEIQAGKPYWLQIEACGDDLRFMVWEDGQPQPALWDVELDSSTIAVGTSGTVLPTGNVGLWCHGPAGTTPRVAIEELEVTGP